MKLVYKCRVYSKNILFDTLQNIKNLFGGRLKIYEKMIEKAIGETFEDFHTCYPTAKNLKVDTEQMGKGTVMVTITGEIPN